MITEITINNFKSVQDLTLSLGRFNVLIGSNGSGKSNILEAIAFGAAANADKLDNEFLGSRGIRTAIIPLMKSAFSNSQSLSPIKLNFNCGDKPITLLINKTQENGEWHSEGGSRIDAKRLQETFSLQHKNAEYANKKFHEFLSLFTDYNIELANFIIYSPDITSLKKFDDENQIKPLGINGEGLFTILEIFYENYGEETINELRKYLHIIEWFDDFEAVFDKVTGRKSLVVKDRNLPGVTLNHTNVNEGFLFLLFYISLIVSNETPVFFAIDNIEASFHPKLCEELIKILVELSKKHNKQIILTTHNPFVLDGLDLNDPEQKLFVVRRNGDGETIADTIKPIKNGKLSEAWMRGRIGGNPETI